MDHESIRARLSALLERTDDPITTLANASAFLFDEIEDLNWLGFYFLRGDALVLYPFQGKPACVSIPVGRGVCGTALAQNQTLRVFDVRTFAGHIACDAASRSELVVPLRDESGAPIGVLDADSASVGRFTETEQALFEDCASIVSRCVAAGLAAVTKGRSE